VDVGDLATRLEREELRALAAERRVAQARQVEMTFRTAGSTGTNGYGDDTGYDRWDVTVVNGSGAPIHDVMVRFGGVYNAAAAAEVEARGLPDGGRRTVPVHLIGGGRSVDFESPRWTEDTVDRSRPALHFTDDNGVRWSRDEFGQLEELQPGSPII
jgi:hypothetical protein